MSDWHLTAQHLQACAAIGNFTGMRVQPCPKLSHRAYFRAVLDDLRRHIVWRTVMRDDDDPSLGKTVSDRADDGLGSRQAYVNYYEDQIGVSLEIDRSDKGIVPTVVCLIHLMI